MQNGEGNIQSDEPGVGEVMLEIVALQKLQEDMNSNNKQPKSQYLVRLSPLLFHEYQGRKKESLEGADEQ